MPRPATGSVRSRVRNGHEQLTLRFSAYGQRYELPAGTDDETRARARLDEILDQIKRGLSQPPRPIKPVPRRAAEPAFGEFAEQWFRSIAPTLTPRGREDYLWALNNHLLPYFTAKLLSEIAFETVDAYGQTKLDEGTLALRRSIRPLPAWHKSSTSRSSMAISRLTLRVVSVGG